MKHKHTPKQSLIRFINQILVSESGCWVWQGFINNRGYARYKNGGHNMTHRWSYEYFKGSIPEGLVIDHMCFVKNCVNPNHLRAITLAKNVSLSNRNPFASIGTRKKQTHCRKGHLFTADNIVMKGKWRTCKKCLINNGYKKVSSSL